MFVLKICIFYSAPQGRKKITGENKSAPRGRNLQPATKMAEGFRRCAEGIVDDLYEKTDLPGGGLLLNLFALRVRLRRTH